MHAKQIDALPAPFNVFCTLSTTYAYFRLHGSYNGTGEKNYSYTLFRYIPNAAIYSQQSLNNIDYKKLLVLIGANTNFIKPYGKYEGFGSIYFQIELRNLLKLWEVITLPALPIQRIT